MAFSEKFIRKQLEKTLDRTEALPLAKLRREQNVLGKLLAYTERKKCTEKELSFPTFKAALISPNTEKFDGIVLYLHGGGYTCGNLEYAKGFASVIASVCSVKVFAPAYRLAPEYKFPAGLNDCEEAYEYLLMQGYLPSQIILAGESAGAGLIYALCLKLKESKKELPAALLAVSPWVDLTQSAKSYEYNQKNDPTLTKERLDFFAKCYSENLKYPLVSPIYGDLAGMPPSLVFSGGGELMLDDATSLVKKLQDCGCDVSHHIAKDMWHAYVLYRLKEYTDDYEQIKSFLGRFLKKSEADTDNWLRLDNAAKIYPASKRRDWTNLFRLSFTFRDNIDEKVLSSALDVTVRRFPSIAVKLGKGLFWYYLERLPSAPELSEESYYPTAKMTSKQVSQCAFRVIAYKNRLAVELFHALTDGTGGMIFLKSLAAEYAEQKYGVKIPCENGILDRREKPLESETEDSFLKYAGEVSVGRNESTPFHSKGTKEPDGFINLTCFKAPLEQVKAVSKEQGVSITVVMCALMMQAFTKLQKDAVANKKKYKPIKVLVPVNLRNLFPSNTLRNFALFITPEINPKMGDYSFKEICQTVNHQIAIDLTPKRMSAKFTSNVRSEQSFILKIMPLFIKNLAMRLVFYLFGENKSCICMSNLGRLELPDELAKHIERGDFILGKQASMPHGCGILCVGDTVYINFTRTIKEPKLEKAFYEALKDIGIEAEIESNKRN